MVTKIVLSFSGQRPGLLKVLQCMGPRRSAENRPQIPVALSLRNTAYLDNLFHFLTQWIDGWIHNDKYFNHIFASLSRYNARVGYYTSSPLLCSELPQTLVAGNTSFYLSMSVGWALPAAYPCGSGSGSHMMLWSRCWEGWVMWVWAGPSPGHGLLHRAASQWHQDSPREQRGSKMEAQSSGTNLGRDIPSLLPCLSRSGCSWEAGTPGVKPLGPLPGRRPL